MYGEPELEFANSQIEGHVEFIELTLKYFVANRSDDLATCT